MPHVADAEVQRCHGGRNGRQPGQPLPQREGAVFCPFPPISGLTFLCVDHPTPIPTSSSSTRVAASYRVGDSPALRALKCTLPHAILALSVLRRSLANRLPLVFDHQVQSLARVSIDQDGPVRVVTAERRRHPEPSRKLGVHLDRGVLLERVGKTGLDAGFVEEVA